MPRAGVERQNLVIEARPAGLVLGDQLRLKCAVTVARNFDWQFAELALQCLAALAVTQVPGAVELFLSR